MKTTFDTSEEKDFLYKAIWMIIEKTTEALDPTCWGSHRDEVLYAEDQLLIRKQCFSYLGIADPKAEYYENSLKKKKEKLEKKSKKQDDDED